MKAVAMFPGQGTQKIGMFKSLYEEYSVVRDVFDRASNVVGKDLVSIINEDAEKLNLTVNTQPCVLACDIASWELLKLTNMNIDFVAGFSLGEYAALFAAGCICLEDVFRLINIRAQAMSAAYPLGEGAMAAVFCSLGNIRHVEELCEKIGNVWISNYNTNGQLTISGEKKSVEKMCRLLSEDGIDTKFLKVSAPFHCPFMQSARDELKDIILNTCIQAPNIPIIMNYDGELVDDPSRIRSNLLNQIVSPVQWIKTLQKLRDENVGHFIECGPGFSLSGFVNKMEFNNIRVSKIIE